MDLLIHVGLHKTGTTALQGGLSANYSCLLKNNILYPRTGLYFSQHALIPGTLLPVHPYLDSVSRSRDPDHYLDLLEQEVTQHQPSLTVISSEVFTEISRNESGCLGIIEGMSRPFDNVSILLTLRNAELQALSSACHILRDNISGHLENPIAIYSNMLRCFRTWHDFWRRSGLLVTEKRLEDSGGNLVDHYIGDIVGTYSQAARDELSQFTLNQGAKGSGANADPYAPLSYLVGFILGNSTLSPAIFSNVTFRDIASECGRTRIAAALTKRVTTAHLLGYLHFFSQEEPAVLLNASPYLSLESKIRAMTAVGLDSGSITHIIEIANRLVKIYS